VTGSGSDDNLTGDGNANTLDGKGGDDVLIGGAGADVLDGGSGTDTADYSASAAGVTINLSTGINTGGDAHGDVLTSIETVIGSSFDDVITAGGSSQTFDGGAGNDALNGGSGKDVFTGGAGADAIDGGSGSDTASYSGSSAGVTVNLATGVNTGGDAQGDTLTNIEDVIGSANADNLTGDGGGNTLDGGGGGDTIDGGGGSDKLNGGTGDDVLVFDASDSLIDGGAGTDTVLVNGGNIDLTAFGGTIQGIEQIDLQTDAGANTFTLSAADVLSTSDTNILAVLGGANDSVNAGTGWTDGGLDGGGNQIYTQGAATLLVDTDITVNADILL
jgi:Ca2+-binding RTX toxin-like protein